jgi:hypothetical protein
MTDDVHPPSGPSRRTVMKGAVRSGRILSTSGATTNFSVTSRPTESSVRGAIRALATFPVTARFGFGGSAPRGLSNISVPVGAGIL